MNDKINECPDDATKFGQCVRNGHGTMYGRSMRPNDGDCRHCRRHKLERLGFDTIQKRGDTKVQ